MCFGLQEVEASSMEAFRNLTEKIVVLKKRLKKEKEEEKRKKIKFDIQTAEKGLERIKNKTGECLVL